MLLLALFSFSLIGPAVFADSESQLPACCRRLGLHHCDALQNTDRQQPSASAVKDASPKCSFFPLAHAVPAHGKTMFAVSAQAVAAPLASYHAGFVQTESLLGLSFSPSHQKRGPPVVL